MSFTLAGYFHHSIDSLESFSEIRTETATNLHSFHPLGRRNDGPKAAESFGIVVLPGPRRWLYPLMEVENGTGRIQMTWQQATAQLRLHRVLHPGYRAEMHHHLGRYNFFCGTESLEIAPSTTCGSKDKVFACASRVMSDYHPA